MERILRNKKKVTAYVLMCLLCSLFFLNDLKVYAATAKIPRLYIDAPENNKSVTGTVNVSGWSLNDSGINKIDILVDNNLAGQAVTGLSRPDVDGAFPGYLNGATSGYQYSLDTSSITEGQHTITVRSTGNDQSVIQSNVTISVRKLKPLICVDEPQNNGKLAGTAKIKGWALNNSGINKVEISVDNKVFGQANIGLPRPDVDYAFPGYLNGVNSGFVYDLDTNSLTEGQHTITVKATGNDQSYAQSNLNVNVEKIKPIMYIDSPAIGSRIKDNVQVNGWALSNLGVKEVDVFVNNTQVGQANYGLDRPDVGKAFPSYLNSSKSGFSYALDISSYNSGNYNVKVRVVSNDNSYVEQTSNVFIDKPAPILYIDGPAAGSKVKDNVLIGGWAVNAIGIKEVDVLLNNAMLGQATYGVSRPDVGRAFSNYPNSSNSGFGYNLDISTLNSGSYNVTIKAIGLNNTISQQSFQLIVDKPMPFGCLDSPSFSSSVKGNVKLSGWALAYPTIKQIDVVLDGNVIGQANYGLDRPDVGAAFPSYLNSSKSGYGYTINTDSLSEGKHTVTLRLIGNNNTITEIQNNMIVDRPSPITYIDSPNVNDTLKGYLNISGWAINYFGINKAEIIVDGTNLGQATYGNSRPDIANVFPGYANAGNSGFNFKVDTRSYGPGNHTVTVRATGNDGVVKEISTNFNLIKPNPITYIDSPSANEVVSYGYNIKGWSLSSYGVSNVEVFIDDVDMGQATYGAQRTDVAGAYPYYIDGDKSGFQFQFDSTKIKNGTHIVKVVSTDSKGVTNTAITTFSILNSDTVYTSYNYTLQQMIDTQYNSSDAPQIYDTTSPTLWRNATRDEVAKYVSPNNFMDSYGKYQFLKLNFTYGVTADDLNSILKGKGVLEGKGDVFLQAGKDNNISPVYLVSHALLETGNGTSRLATGYYVINGKNVYNMFGIHAFDSAPDAYGSQYAYDQGWFSVDLAISGGAKWIANNYINNPRNKQDTLYKMRWNPASPASYQYATDVAWAYNQIYNIKKLMDLCPKAVLIFDIPQYKQ